jgi:hypothetical protein
MGYMNSLIKGLQNNGFTIWFTANNEFDIMDYNTIRVFANVKKGEGRKVLIKTVFETDYTICKSQKEALEWFLNNYNC